MDREFRKKVQIIAHKLFDEAYENQDFFECAKAIGVLEMVKDPSVTNLSALAFSMIGDYKKTLEYVSSIPKESRYYEVSQLGLIGAYINLGNYLELDKCLESGINPQSPLEEMCLRLKCLVQMDEGYFVEHKSDLEKIEFKDVDVIPNELNNHESAIFFQICSLFSACLKVACDCIFECVKYQNRMGKKIDDFTPEGNTDLITYFSAYERLCYILSQSRHLRNFIFPQNASSLADLVFEKKPWNDKLKSFSELSFDISIIQVIFSFCNPELHKNINSFEAVEYLLDLFIEIKPSVIAQIIDQYFEIVSNAYKKSFSSAIQYVGYVYSEIIATQNDRFNLKDRIEDLQKNEEFDYEKNVISISLKNTMSQKAYDALQNAYLSYRRVEKLAHGAEDYSALSLQFFRVIEIEFCERLIIPLANSVCNVEFERMIDECASNNQEAWKKDLYALKKISEKGQGSIEIGTARTMLFHTISGKFRDDRCAVYLRQQMALFLSSEGQQALDREDMLRVIDKNVLFKYRIPGAHTGFSPFSIAKESKEYVEKHLLIIEKWFA